MKTTSAAYRFTAIHSVPRDARFSDPHRHDWKLVAHVSGKVCGTGWIMSFQDLQAILKDVVPGDDLDVLADNATVEALVDEFWGLVRRRLPTGLTLVRLELHETEDFMVALTA